MGLFKRQSYRGSKFDGDFIFSDFSYGLYNLDTPRGLSEQLTTLAITGGRNVWTERGALVSQYGYDLKDQFAENDIPYLVSSDNSSANNIFIICLNGNVYYYTTLEGLRKYATPLTDIDSPIIAHNGGVLYLTTDDAAYIYGASYDDADFVKIFENRAVTSSGSQVTINITESEKKYFWLDKKVVIRDGLEGSYTYYPMYVISISKLEDNPNYDYSLLLYFEEETSGHSFTDPIAVGEKTLRQLSLGQFDETADPPTLIPLQEGFYDFTWVNESGAATIEIKDRILHPKLMAVALNRLWVVDEDNTIFYSAVGSMTNFEQNYGAGYFRGFYQDTSEVLSIEEFFSGVLITKQTGMYHARLTTNKYSYTESIESSMSENYININKISNITQKYPGDHVVIGSEVIAFDDASGNIVQAAYVNYLNQIQEGSVLLHGSELDSQSLGIQSSNKRVLAYSFRDEVLLLYYGSELDQALVINRGLSIFPRETNLSFLDVQMFAQGFINITTDGYVLEDFKRGTIIPNITPVAEFEHIGLRGNKMLSGTIIEITELNGVKYNIATMNAGNSEQEITPTIIQINRNSALPNLIYSDETINFYPTSFAESTKWASQKSSVTRIAAPLGGRDGLGVRLEFEPNVSFCLCAIRFPDMSQGE